MPLSNHPKNDREYGHGNHGPLEYPQQWRPGSQSSGPRRTYRKQYNTKPFHPYRGNASGTQGSTHSRGDSEGTFSAYQGRSSSSQGAAHRHGNRRGSHRQYQDRSTGSEGTVHSLGKHRVTYPSQGAGHPLGNHRGTPSRYQERYSASQGTVYPFEHGKGLYLPHSNSGAVSEGITHPPSQKPSLDTDTKDVRPASPSLEDEVVPGKFPKHMKSGNRFHWVQQILKAPPIISMNWREPRERPSSVPSFTEHHIGPNWTLDLNQIRRHKDKGTAVQLSTLLNFIDILEQKPIVYLLQPDQAKDTHWDDACDKIQELEMVATPTQRVRLMEIAEILDDDHRDTRSYLSQYFWSDHMSGDKYEVMSSLPHDCIPLVPAPPAGSGLTWADIHEVPEGKFLVGDIVNAPHVDMARDRRLMLGNNRNITQSQVGPLIHKKRPMIVVMKYEKHMTALPIRSHGSRGLGHLSPNERRNFAGIQFEDDEEYKNETPYPETLKVNARSRFKPTPRSAVDLATPVTLHYDNRVEVQGSLANDSILNLGRYHMKVWTEKLQEQILKDQVKKRGEVGS